MAGNQQPELFDLVAVTAPSGVPELGVGDVGTVVELLPPDGVEVEFLTRDGRTRYVGGLPVRNVLTLGHVGDKARATDCVSPSAVRWARKNILRFGDTDLLPVSFEYQVLAGPSWSATYDHVCRVDLASYSQRPFRRYLVPKPGAGFRIAHLLDPIDAILYAAAAYEMSTAIESSRVSKESRVACSYRVDATDEGRLYAEKNGWSDYDAQSADLARRHAFALETDIADFYSQVSHQGLSHALRDAGVPERRVESLDRLLGFYSPGQKKGIPVGPAASHVLAEACLSRVDRMLLDKGYAFARYVDDFRVFAQDRTAAISASYEIAKYLDNNYRLAIQDAKTSVRPTEELLAHRLANAQREADDEKERSLAELIADMRRNAAYGVDLEDFAVDDAGPTAQRMLLELVSEALDSSPIQFGTISHALRLAKSIRTDALHGIVLDDLRALSPVLRDVCNYLMATFPSDELLARAVGDRLIDFATGSDYSACPYVRLWVLHVLCEQPSASTYEAVASLAEKGEADLGVRPHALAASAFKRPDWVGDRMATVMDFAPWDRRALIWAGQALLRKERRAWLARVLAETDDPLDVAVASHVRSLPV